MSIFSFGKNKRRSERDLERSDQGNVKPTQIFISHRYKKDQRFLAAIKGRLEDHVRIDDGSLTKEQMLSGPRGGKVPGFEVKKEIFDRISQSDVVICRNTSSITNNEWISWEIDTAAIALKKPILFVDDRIDAVRGSAIYTELKNAEAIVGKCELDGHRMINEIKKLTNQLSASPAAAQDQ